MAIPILHDFSDDQRRLRRERELSAGLVVMAGESFVSNCLIRDTSPGGAKIRIHPTSLIAPGAYLINLRRGTASRLRPIWRRASLTGLRTFETMGIDGQLPGHLAFLRSLFDNAQLCLFRCGHSLTGAG